jgi:hypothetical protein
MITSGHTTVGTSPTLIDGREVMPFRLVVHNNDNTDAMYLGNADVTTSTGLLINKQETIELIINPLEALYAVSSKAGHIISWLKQTEV